MVLSLSTAPALPTLIQGGMGIGVSHWRLARAVSLAGQLGVVSGTALNSVFVRRLQLGDLDGQMRHALQHCPLPGAAERILNCYYIAGGKSATARFRLAPIYSQHSPRDLIELTVVANFAEVFLAKENHHGLVGINLLEKIQLPTLPSLYGAMLADVDYVLMGAGIPRAIPGILDQLARGEAVSLKLAVEQSADAPERLMTFDPSWVFPGTRCALRRPSFLAIVSSATLAMTLARKSSGKVDGFVVEVSTAGGHNAPPRGTMQLNAAGEPIYGERDVPNLETIRGLGLPFWLAGSYASAEKISEAQVAGATGVQVGTAFAFCEESGLQDSIKRAVISRSKIGVLEVRTDLLASPTGMPFKVITLPGTVADPEVYRQRLRLCDLGYLRQPFAQEDGTLGYRCPAEPPDAFQRKGGTQDCTGRKCLCNGLLAAIGLGQTTTGSEHEPPIVTAGNDAVDVTRFLPMGQSTYTAADVLRYLELLPAQDAVD